MEKANLLPKIENNNEANASNSMVNVVVKGYVKTISIDTSYGNATYYICDNAKGLGKALEVYRGLSVGGATFKKKDEVKVGDLVVVQGTIVNFKGTLEFTTGSKILSLNGEGESGGDTPGSDITPSGDGTETSPFNIAAAIAKCTEVGETASTDKYYIKGLAESEITIDSYKNLTVNLVDKDGSTAKFMVYRVKAADNKGLKEGYKIAKGATVIVYGPVVNFKGNTPETASGAYLVSVNGQAPELDGQ